MILQAIDKSDGSITEYREDNDIHTEIERMAGHCDISPDTLNDLLLAGEEVAGSFRILRYVNKPSRLLS